MKRQVSPAKAKRMIENERKEMEVMIQKDELRGRIAKLSAELSIVRERNDSEAKQRILAEMKELLDKIHAISV